MKDGNTALLSESAHASGVPENGISNPLAVDVEASESSIDLTGDVFDIQVGGFGMDEQASEEEVNADVKTAVGVHEKAAVEEIKVKEMPKAAEADVTRQGMAVSHVEVNELVYNFESLHCVAVEPTEEVKDIGNDKDDFGDFK